MEEKHVNSIMGWFRRHFGNPRNEPQRAELCRSSQCLSGPSKSFKNPNSFQPSSTEYHSPSSVVYSEFSSPSSSSSFNDKVLDKPSDSGHPLTSVLSSSVSSFKSSIEDYYEHLIISSSSSHSSLPSSSSSPLPPALSSSFRWSLDFDLCVCHAESDVTLANSLVCYLESQTHALRCFLQHRDSTPGGAISTELLHALSRSHCCLLLVSPGFLQDQWCLYQMQQALCECPLGERIIPAMVELSCAELPSELRFVYTLDLNRKLEKGFKQVYRTIINYLKDMSEKENPFQLYKGDETCQ